MSDHYTLRLAEGTRTRLARYARRAGLPERALAQRYLEEGLRHDAHPLIHFVEGPTGRRASLLGSGFDVWAVIATVRDNDGSLEEAAAYLQIPLGLVQAAVAYYGEHRDEIDAEMELNEAEYQRGFEAAAAGARASRVKALLDEQLSPRIAKLLRDRPTRPWNRPRLHQTPRDHTRRRRG